MVGGRKKKTREVAFPIWAAPNKEAKMPKEEFPSKISPAFLLG